MALVQTSVKLESWQLEAAKHARINLSHLLRSAVKAALKCSDDLEKEEADIQKQKAILAAREEMLDLKKKRKVKARSEEALEMERRYWLKDHPQFLDGYNSDKISSKGWQVLLRELGFTDKKQAEKYLQKIYFTDNLGGIVKFLNNRKLVFLQNPAEMQI